MLISRTRAFRLSSTLATAGVSAALVFATAVPSQAAEVQQTVQTGYTVQELHAGASAVDVRSATLISAAAPVAAPAPAAATTPAPATAANPTAPARSGSGTSTKAAAVAPGQTVVGSSIVDTARLYIGKAYVSGGNGPDAFDCSGFTKFIYGLHGISLPRTDSTQKAAGTVISQADARPGDLVWWPGHIGIYAGGNQVIDAGSARTGVSQRAIWGSPLFLRY